MKQIKRIGLRPNSNISNILLSMVKVAVHFSGNTRHLLTEMAYLLSFEHSQIFLLKLLLRKIGFSTQVTAFTLSRTDDGFFRNLFLQAVSNLTIFTMPLFSFHVSYEIHFIC